MKLALVSLTVLVLAACAMAAPRDADISGVLNDLVVGKQTAAQSPARALFCLEIGNYG